MTSRSVNRVIHVPRRFVRQEWGGTETTILQLCKAMLGKNVATEIYTSAALASSGSEEIGGVRVRRFGYFYPFLRMTAQLRDQMDRKGGNLFSFSLFWALLTCRGLDLIHLHTGKRLGGIIRTVARLRGVPYVVTLHGGVFDVPVAEQQAMLRPAQEAGFEWGRLLGALVGARRVLEDADAIICVGANEAAAAQRALPGKRVEMMPNGVDCAAFAQGDGPAFRATYGIAADRKLILCLSRIDYQKNQLSLVEALPQILTVEPNAHLLLIGPVTVPEYNARLQQRISDLDLGSQVTQLPGISFGDHQLYDAYQAADVFCLPSLHEPFGIVILEAWAAGLPVVAAKTGGITGFTADRDNVLWIDPSDPGSISTAVTELLTDSQLASRIAFAGRERARTQYDWGVIAQRLLRLYAELTVKGTAK